MYGFRTFYVVLYLLPGAQMSRLLPFLRTFRVHSRRLADQYDVAMALALRPIFVIPYALC